MEAFFIPLIIAFIASLAIQMAMKGGLRDKIKQQKDKDSGFDITIDV